MNTPISVPEEFLHFVWENRIFYTENLQTQKGEPLEIISTGKKNTNSGPDFFNAKIKIGRTLWAGNIEIHKKASDWGKHNHTTDKAYENVILHVVEQADEQVFRENNTTIATLEMRWPEQFTHNYQKLLDAKTWVACQEQFYQIDPVMVKLGLNRLMIERLEQKTGLISQRLEQNQHNWNETFYQMLARMFGFKVNSAPFEWLAKAVPLHYLAKHKNNLVQLEAMLFGASGLLHEELFGDQYYLDLRKEFDFLHKKYGLNTVEPHLWKFMRLRPVNFPTIRISQLAALIHRSKGLLSKVLETSDLEELKTLLKVEASPYWNDHYRFNRLAPVSHPKILGESSINILIINVIVPFLFVYGELQNQHHLKNRAIEFLEKLPPENNSIIKKWGNMGVEASSAFESQALLQLKNFHCELKKCLTCPIGNKLVKSNVSDSTHPENIQEFEL